MFRWVLPNCWCVHTSQFGGIVLCLDSAKDGNHTYFNKGLWKLSLQNYQSLSWVNFNKEGRLLEEVRVCHLVLCYSSAWVIQSVQYQTHTSSLSSAPLRCLRCRAGLRVGLSRSGHQQRTQHKGDL